MPDRRGKLLRDKERVSPVGVRLRVCCLAAAATRDSGPISDETESFSMSHFCRGGFDRGDGGRLRGVGRGSPPVIPSSPATRRSGASTNRVTTAGPVVHSSLSALVSPVGSPNSEWSRGGVRTRPLRRLRVSICLCMSESVSDGTHSTN